MNYHAKIEEANNKKFRNLPKPRKFNENLQFHFFKIIFCLFSSKSFDTENIDIEIFHVLKTAVNNKLLLCYLLHVLTQPFISPFGPPNHS